jgi:mannose-1-phosphate guanylyltransferase
VTNIVPVILAGGIGERFWPMSRSSMPKQLLSLTSGRTMIEETFTRANGVRSPNTLPLVITGRQIASRMNALLLKKRRYDTIVEPVGKNTAPALALAAAWIEARHGESIMVVMPADHDIRPLVNFKQAVRHACDLADAKDRLVVFGVKPDRPETGYGYIQLGSMTGSKGRVKSYEVRKFIEKPGLARAKTLSASEKYRWNSGMFVWKTSVLLEEFKTYMPGCHALVQKAKQAGFTKAAIDRFYLAVEKESIDYGIMERSRRVSAVVGEFAWDDIGSWESLSRVCPSNAHNTTIVGDAVYGADNRNCIIVNKSPHALAAIGCEDLAVVATGDAILVMARSKLPDIKKYLGEMKKTGAFPGELF